MFQFGEQIPALLDVLRSPFWLIAEDRLGLLEDLYRGLLAGMLPRELGIPHSVVPPAFAVMVAAERAASAKPIPVAGGVARLSIAGPIFKRPNFLTEYFGFGTSSDQLTARVREALHLADVHALVLEVDSGGGEVSGTQNAADAIRAMRGPKPIEAVINDAGYSAAYWLASAADRITLSSGTAGAGSIGVIAVYADMSEAYKKEGIGLKVIKSRKLKAAGNGYEPMSADEEAAIRQNIMAVDAVFGAAVAQNRGGKISEAQIAVLDGRTLTGTAAIQAGLADRIATLDQVMAELQLQAPRRTMVSAFVPAGAGTF